MTQNGTPPKTIELKEAGFSGEDVWWVINGIIFVVAMFKEAGVTVEDWIDVFENDRVLDPKIGLALLQGMSGAAEMPEEAKMGRVFQFLQQVGAKAIFDSGKFDA